MAITFKDVLDRSATTLWKDYKLDWLYNTNKEAFYDFLSGFLVNSCDMFNGCLSSLSYHEELDVDNNTIYVFDENLSSKEVYILCLGVCIGWFNQKVLDVTQFENHLNTRDFKSFSEANSLKEKRTTYQNMYENFRREITEYQLNNFKKLPFFGGENYVQF